MKNFSLLGLVALSVSLSACGKKSALEDADSETAQQVGDLVASIDEMGGSSGTIASLGNTGPSAVIAGIDEDRLLRDARPVFARYGELLEPRGFGLLSDARAASCLVAPGFGSCSGGTITRTFGGCTLGLATFTGTVTLTWGGSASGCSISGAGGHITRVPDFSVTGLRSVALSVSKTGSIGQRLTFTGLSGSSPVFSFSNDGIRRQFTSGGTSLFDFTSATTSAITITGNTRAARVIDGGNLRVTNNKTGVVCDFVPSTVTWNGSCNCPSSGKWSASCTDGKAGTLTITGCGTADFETEDNEGSVTFDRCYGS